MTEKEKDEKDFQERFDAIAAKLLRLKELAEGRLEAQQAHDMIYHGRVQYSGMKVVCPECGMEKK